MTHEQRTTAGQLAGTESAYSTAYSYNISGALLTETYPSGRVVTNNYNTDGELESVWGQKANQQTAKLYINQISLNSSGAVEKARLGNGTWETAAYNDRLQITQIGLGHSATDKSLLKIDYDYGNNQQNNGSLREQKVNYTGLANQITQNYTYDDLNRIKSATETVVGTTPPIWKQTFDYDRFGNREFDAGNTTTMIDSKATNPEILTANNRFKEDQDNDSVNDYDYDENGNLKLDADNQRYIFDAENRIKEFFKSTNGTTNNPNAVYEYDGEGKRVKKVSDGVTTIFVYNAGGTLVAEYSTELNPEPQVSYLTADHLGSPRIVTDGGGAVISRHDYMAFGDEVTQKLGNVGGRTTAQGYGKPDDVRKQYTGYERDKESGLDYAQARYYSSAHGRFTSVDPLTASASIRNPQTFNRYSYVLNSPYKFTDPLGLIIETPMSYQSTGSALGDRLAGGRGSKRDFDLLQWHIANGTALGYSYLNAMQSRQQSGSSPSDDDPKGGNGKPKINVKVKKTIYKPYAVEGENAEEALNNAKISCNGKQSTACTTANYSFVTTPKTKGKSTFTSEVTLTATMTVKLPEWKGYSTASEAEQEAWDKSIGKLPSHEEDHVTIFKEGATEIANAIPASAKTEKELFKIETNNFNNARAIIQARSNELDRVTDNGRK